MSPYTPASIEVVGLLARPVSLFATVRTKRPPSQITIRDYFDGIVVGRWRAKIEAVRAANARSKEEAETLKKRLPAITPSGTFRGLGDADFLAHSGILCIDLDDVGPSLAHTRARLQTLPCVLAVHLSPRGTGLKVFVVTTATTPEEHDLCWPAAEAELRPLLPLGVKLDPAPKSVVSKCFVSYDPAAWVADTPRIPLFPHDPLITLGSPRTPLTPRREKRKRVISEGSMSDTGCESLSMSDFRGKTLSAEASPYAGEIQQREGDTKTRQRAHLELKRMTPRLRSIYRQYIETKPVNRGERHAFLLKVILPLFEVLAEPVLVDLLRLHHRSQTGTWDAVLDFHMQEVKEVLDFYRSKYREALPPRERTVFYDRLNEEKRRAAFRICRGLATCEKARESAVFYLSCGELATRIGCDRDTAHEILCEFKAERLIECVRVGDALPIKMPEGEKRKATTWRWIG